jgi:NAD(P)-dependent dehydrogenase (short-subunit alcohol dehydrogenase family)
VNLKGYFFCAQQAALVMRRGGAGGRIVNISSMGAFLAWPEHVHYCASKAGVVGMTRALAKALAPEITVNSVAPGMIRFGEIAEPRIQRIIADTPAGRAGTGREVAEGVAYFLGASEFVTGQVLQVDGGMGLR